MGCGGFLVERGGFVGLEDYAAAEADLVVVEDGGLAGGGAFYGVGEY